MKYTLFILLAGWFTTQSQAQDYTNFIRQTQFPTGVQYDVPVESVGERLSALAIDPGGARFELWTVKGASLASYLLDTQYVGAYIPTASVSITSEDPYEAIPRTRADRYFNVQINVSGMLNGAADPPASKSVILRRFLQSYGPVGTGEGIDRSLATERTETTLTSNGEFNLNYPITEIPGTPRTKARGEERFSVYSMADYQAPEEIIATRYVQIWPVADASISGITEGQVIKSQMPDVALDLNDLYPDSQTYARVYKGAPNLLAEGSIVPGSALVVSDSVPRNADLSLTDWDDLFDADGPWTLEVLTTTPFGTDRLAYVSFSLDRTIRINGSVTSFD